MRTFKLVFTFILFPSLLCGQVYFPLHVGDWWGCDDQTYICEGTSIVCMVSRDTSINGKTFFQISRFYSGSYVRADLYRVFEYDTTTNIEHVLFDFTAKPGDTVSVRDSGRTVTTALGSLQFLKFDTLYHYGDIFAIRDSVGVVSVTPTNLPCRMELRSAFIGGKMIILGVETSQSSIPSQIFLAQNYPNPFNPSTKIRFSIPSSQTVSLEVFNVLGEKIELLLQGQLLPGWHDIEWNAGKYPSGIYFYRLTTTLGSITKSSILLK